MIYNHAMNKYVGLSSEEKPSANLSEMFYETDTGLTKIYNGLAWVQFYNPARLGGSGAYTPPADWLDIETGIPDGAINLLVNDSTLRTYALKCTTRGKNLLTYNQATVEEGTDGFDAFSGTASQDLIEHWQGLASLKFITNNSGLGEGLVGVGLACSVEVNYVVSCYVKGSGTLNLEIADDDGVSVDTVPITLTNTWTRYEATISPTVGYLNVRVITDSQQSATFYIDGLQLELGTVATAFEAPPAYGENLLTENQYGVETDTTGFITANDATLTQDLTEHYEGLASLKAVAPNAQNQEGFVILFEGGLASGIYRASIYLKGSGTLSFDFEDGGTIKDSVSVILTNEWVEYTTTISLPSGNVFAMISVATDSQQSATFYADKIELRKLEVPQYQVNWGDGTTTLYDSNTVAQHTYTLGAGEPCSRGYTTFKVVISPDTGDLLSFRTVQHSLGTQTQTPGILGAIVNSDTITSLDNAFSNSSNNIRCSYIEYFKAKKGASVITAVNMLSQCQRLQLLDLSTFVNLVTASSMISGCQLLSSIDLSALVNVEIADNMITNCPSISSIDLSALVNVEIADNMISYCSGLLFADLSTLTKVTSAQYLANSCFLLQEIVLTNFGSDSASVDLTEAFSGCEQLTQILLPNTKIGIIGASGDFFGDNKLSVITFSALSPFDSLSSPQFGIKDTTLTGTQIDSVFTDLPVVIGTQVIDITGCTGAGDCTPTIATLKGWTVTGYTGA